MTEEKFFEFMATLEKKREAERQKDREELEKYKVKREDERKEEKEKLEAEKKEEKEKLEAEKKEEKEKLEAEKKEEKEKLEAEREKDKAEWKKLKEMIFGIGKNQGYVAEEFFVNSLAVEQTIAGIQYDKMIPNLKGHIRGKNGLEGEFDIVLVNGKDVAIVETKYKVHEKDLDKFLNKQYPKFNILFPEYKNYNHHLALASFYIDDKIKQEALDKGVIVLQRNGNVMETFEPKK